MSSVETPGFICPYCLVRFASPGNLQSHFVDMHSGAEFGLDSDEGEEMVGAAAGYGPLGEEEEEVSRLVLVSFLSSTPLSPRFLASS